MNNDKSIKQFFFQPNFEELAFSRSMSHCSFFANDQMDLSLEIEDVVELNDLELQNYKLPFFSKDPSMVFEDFGEDFLQKGLAVNVEIEKKSAQSVQMVASEESSQNEPVPRVSKKIKKMSKNAKSKQKVPKTFYEKNICRNIIRKVIRMVESGVYKEELLRFCGNDEEFYNEFGRIMISNIEMITGPRALEEFLKVQDEISQVFKRFSIWYLKQRYIRDAINEGHMTNVEKYIQYKNEVLLPMVDKL